VVLRCSRYGRLTVTPADAAAARDLGWRLAMLVFATLLGTLTLGVLGGAVFLTLSLFGVTMKCVAEATEPWERRTLVVRVGVAHAVGLALWTVAIAALVVLV
jgi:hypothetical protein